MAKRSAIERNRKRERLVAQYAQQRRQLKAMIHNRKTPMTDRFAAQLKLQRIPRNATPVRVRNRCALTGRTHGVYRKFKLSRIALRELASAGMLPGVTKASW